MAFYSRNSKRQFLIQKKTQLLLYIYTLLVCLFVCPFVFNKRQNGWANRIPGKVYGYSKFQKVVSKSFYLACTFKNALKNIWKSANVFTFSFILYKEKMFKDRATIKSYNRGWAQSGLKVKYIYTLLVCMFDCLSVCCIQ